MQDEIEEVKLSDLKMRNQRMAEIDVEANSAASSGRRRAVAAGSQIPEKTSCSVLEFWDKQNSDRKKKRKTNALPP